jgi:hypothetical protein
MGWGMQMTAAVLNSIGLLLGILGLMVIYEWGPPQPRYEGGRFTALQHGTITQEELELLKQKAAAWLLSAIGLGLIGLGFACQLLAVWVPYI